MSRLSRSSRTAVSKKLAVGSLLARTARLITPANIAFRIKVAQRGKAPSPTVYIVPHNRNNVRLTIDASRHLTESGIRCVFVHLDGLKGGGVARPELDKFGAAYIDFATLTNVIRPGDMLLTGNDYAPQFFRHFIDSINFGLVKVVGLIGGARLLRPHRFVRADTLLAMGPAVLSQRPQPTYIVGSAVIERYLREPALHRREGRFVLISFKGEWEEAQDRVAVEAAVAACKSLDLPYVVSVHPTMAARTVIPNASSADFGSLLPEAMALISRPSTTVYEAMVCGIPVVLYPLVSPLVEFEEPRGAFRLTRDPAELVDDLKEAVGAREQCLARSRDFLEHHVSIDPEMPSSRRIARALMDILGTAHDRAPATPDDTGPR